MSSLSQGRCPRRTLLLAAALGFACRAEPGSPFESELARLAGRSAAQCGIFKLEHDPRAAEGWRCAQAAERAGKPYWIAVLGAGEDSTVGQAAVRTPAGAHLVLDYDSDRGGHRPAQSPQLSTTPCAAVFDYQPASWPRWRCATR